MTSPLPPAEAPALTEDAFFLLRDLIEAHFGLRYETDTAYLLERRLQPRLLTLQLRSFLDYYDYLKNLALPEIDRIRELEDIYERLATRETYFFRESYQLDVLREILLPQLHSEQPRGKRLALWSAGCATGEEVYSLAIQVLESGLFDGWQVQIIGTDLSRTALDVAQRGVYGPSSFRQTEARLHQRYFRPLTGRWEVLPEVKRMCTFLRGNLIRDDFSIIGGPFDAVFCRNVLIYFSRQQRVPLIAKISDRLSPGGYLFLGHSESLLDVSTPLQLSHLGREMVYRRPLATGPIGSR